MAKVLLQPEYSLDCFPNFNSNMELPRHRWYSFKEGYSATLVKRAIQEFRVGQHKSLNILDPFSGSGTTALVAAENHIDATAIEVNPFLAFVSIAKCSYTDKTEKDLSSELQAIMNLRPYELESPIEGVSTFSSRPELKKWLFNQSVIRGFEALKSNIYQVSGEFSPFMLALYSAITDCSNAKRDGKCLRYKKNWKSFGYSSLELRQSFEMYCRQVIRDLQNVQLGRSKQNIINDSALSVFKNNTLTDQKFDIIVFSPPYLNSFDYTDVYRPELFLGGFVKNQDELKELRSRTLRSHVQYNWASYDECSSSSVNKIVQSLNDRISELWDKRIPRMISSYFADMESILTGAFQASNRNASMWIVVSTSAYAGLEIPVDLILAELAQYSGWKLDGVHTLRSIRSASQHISKTQKPDNMRLRESLIRLSRN